MFFSQFLIQAYVSCAEMCAGYRLEQTLFAVIAVAASGFCDPRGTRGDTHCTPLTSFLASIAPTHGDEIYDACEELLKVTDVWSYFDTDSGKRALCTVCQASVGNEYDELKAHLKDNHPKLLLQLLQNKDPDSEADDGDDDNENAYTEIVYLEQEQAETVTKHKEKPKSFPKPMKKRERLQSQYSSDELPFKKAKKEDESDELGTFIKYITCLLKKLPEDVFSNVQIEIINTILKANSLASTANTSWSKELINTSSNSVMVDGIKPINSAMMGHNYSMTVAPPKESDTENGD